MAVAKDKLTEAQKREVERLRQFATRNRFELKMNSTRWRAALDAILNVAGYSLSYRNRSLTDLQEPDPAWKMDFPQGLPLYNAIEWLEVRWQPQSQASREDRKEFQAKFPKQLLELGGLLKAAQIPFETIENGVRIIGYSRPI